MYFMNFSPDGRHFSYHAYDKKTITTFLVRDDQEISVYPDHEGYPQAANGVSEAWGPHGQFAYARVTKDNPDMMEIYKNDRLVNKISGELIYFWFSDDGSHLEYVVSTTAGPGRSNHYVDDKLVESDVDYNRYVRYRDSFPSKQGDVTLQDKYVLVGGKQLADYSTRNPEVYLSSLTVDNSGTDVAYKVWRNHRPDTQVVSLNGHDSEESFNDIRELKFADDGKMLSYIGRQGRTIYHVTQEVRLAR